MFEIAMKRIVLLVIGCTLSGCAMSTTPLASEPDSEKLGVTTAALSSEADDDRIDDCLDRYNACKVHCLDQLEACYENECNSQIYCQTVYSRCLSGCEDRLDRCIGKM